MNLTFLCAMIWRTSLCQILVFDFFTWTDIFKDPILPIKNCTLRSLGDHFLWCWLFWEFFCLPPEQNSKQYTPRSRENQNNNRGVQGIMGNTGPLTCGCYQSIQANSRIRVLSREWSFLFDPSFFIELLKSRGHLENYLPIIYNNHKGNYWLSSKNKERISFV